MLNRVQRYNKYFKYTTIISQGATLLISLGHMEHSLTLAMPSLSAPLCPRATGAHTPHPAWHIRAPPTPAPTRYRGENLWSLSIRCAPYVRTCVYILWNIGLSHKEFGFLTTCIVLVSYCPLGVSACSFLLSPSWEILCISIRVF